MPEILDIDRPLIAKLKRIEYEPDFVNASGRAETRHGYYLALFVLEHHRGIPEREVEYPVWLHENEVGFTDVVRAARHQLHHELSALAGWTQPWKLPDDEAARVFQNDPAAQ